MLDGLVDDFVLQDRGWRTAAKTLLFTRVMPAGVCGDGASSTILPRDAAGVGVG